MYLYVKTLSNSHVEITLREDGTDEIVKTIQLTPQQAGQLEYAVHYSNTDIAASVVPVYFAQ